MSKEFLNREGLLTLIDELKEYIDIHSVLIIKKDSLDQFSLIGEEKYLYIDSSTNKSYRWDDTDLKYYCVGSDYSQINIIDGGSSAN